MNPKVQKIIEDIYMIDDSLKSKEKELIVIIEKLMENKPEIKLDESFVARLRSDLLKEDIPIKKDQFNIFNLFNDIFMKKLAYALGGAALTLLLMIPVLTLLNKEQKAGIKLPKSRIGFYSKINRVGDNAFGSIDLRSNVAESNVLEEKGIGAGGGGGLVYSGQTAPTSSSVGIPAPVFVNFNYTYKGDDFETKDEKMSVYKKIKEGLGGNSLSSLIQNKDYGLVDLSKFENTKVSSISVVEDREFGYSVSLNFYENLIFIHQDWKNWPRIDCPDQECFEDYRLNIEDIPGDDELVNIADKFLNDYSIDLSDYGDGVVRNEWRVFYEQQNSKGLAYVPEIISVSYPLKIENRSVYEESGDYSGLIVDVDIRYKRVASLNGLSAQSYESSDYDVITDSQKIIEEAQSGGILKQYEHPDPTKIIEVELGTPILGLVRHFKYHQENSSSTELFVPAYIFPVISVSEENYFYRKNVVVPLVGEMYEDRDDMVIPRPLIEPVVGELKAEGVDE